MEFSTSGGQGCADACPGLATIIRVLNAQQDEVNLITKYLRMNFSSELPTRSDGRFSETIARGEGPVKSLLRCAESAHASEVATAFRGQDAL